MDDLFPLLMLETAGKSFSQPHFYDIDCKQICIATFQCFNVVVGKVSPTFL